MRQSETDSGDSPIPPDPTLPRESPAAGVLPGVAERNKVTEYFDRVIKWKENRFFKAVISLRELVALVFAMIAFGEAPFSTPELTARVDATRLLPPQGMIHTLDSVLALDSSRNALRNRLQNLISSTRLVTIDLTNHTSEDITKVSLSVSNIISVADVAMSSDDTTIPDSFKEFAVKDGELTFPKLRSIPPSSSLTIQFWGRLLSAEGKTGVQLSSAAKSNDVSSVRKGSGFAFFLDENLEFLGVLVGGSLLLLGLYRIRSANA